MACCDEKTGCCPPAETPKDRCCDEKSGCCEPMKSSNEKSGCCSPAEPQKGGCCGPKDEKKLKNQQDMGCCGPTPKNSDAVRDLVREQYGKVAEADRPGLCGGSKVLDLPTAAKQLGYTEEDIASLPEGADMGLGCGNPVAIANLQPGMTTLDLGSGGGIDVFLAAKKVGSTGLSIGVDMTPAMV